MFALYIDDSGSAQDQPVAIAAGIVIPAVRLKQFEDEWTRFLEKEEIATDGFHSSVCFHRNPHSVFKDWTDERVGRVFERILQMFQKYVVKAYCSATCKKDYDELVPQNMRECVSKNHFVWALSSVLGLSYDWSSKRVAPMKYVFDMTDKETKRDIVEAIEYLAQPGSVYGDHFSDHPTFLPRKSVPGLQLADFFAWLCYQHAHKSITGKQVPDLVDRVWNKILPDISTKLENSRIVVQRLSREGLADWVKKTYGTPADLAIREFKSKRKNDRMPKRNSVR